VILVSLVNPGLIFASLLRSDNKMSTSSMGLSRLNSKNVLSMVEHSDMTCLRIVGKNLLMVVQRLSYAHDVNTLSNVSFEVKYSTVVHSRLYHEWSIWLKTLRLKDRSVDIIVDEPLLVLSIVMSPHVYNRVFNVTVGSIDTETFVAERNDVVGLSRVVHPFLIVSICSLSQNESCSSVILTSNH